MKQYKFKCPICGKWHDIFYSLGDYVAECDGEQTAYAHFQAKKLETLLKLLRKLNIEVAEVCDRLRWRKNDLWDYISNDVLIGNRVHRYYISHEDDYRLKYSPPNPPKVWIWRKFRSVKDEFADTLKNAKAACQADFQERRAR